ncbi:type I restriction endonuclease subunit R, partial [Phocaeicola vulgatus]
DCLSTIVFILPLHLDYTKVIILILWWRNFQLEYWRTFQLVSTERDDFDYPIDTYITETGTGTIDAEYINSKFVKFIKNLYMSGPGSELTKEAFKELHKTFASLSQKDQRTAMIILHDLQSGDLHLSPGKTIYDYIAEYQFRELHKQVMILAEATGINASQLEHIMSRNVTEQNLNEFSQFDNLKLTLNMAKTREFITKVEGTEVPARLVIPKADKLLREFILDSSCRERILKAYLNMEENYQSEEEQVPQDEDVITDEVQHVDVAVIKDNIRSILKTTLTAVLPQMRPIDEIINSVFYVIDTPSIDSLDNVGMFIQRAFTNLYGKRATIVDKFVAFNLLVTKFEAYLKKLYYLMKGHEVPAQNPGEDVTWKNVIYAHKCLWNLKYSTDEGKQQLYQYLMLIKGWRNSESHISPTASEKEVDTAISIILTMYFYSTGSSITDLEMNGHEIQKSESVHKENSYVHKVIQLHPYYNEENDDQQLVAEADVKNWPEEKRIATLKKSICQFIGYDPKKSPLSKQRHWIAIYRIAADKGFIIEGDFAYFKRIIDDMQINNFPVPLKIESLQSSIKDVYAKDIEDWTDDNLSGKKLAEYEDIKKCADAFAKIVGNNINTK